MKAAKQQQHVRLAINGERESAQAFVKAWKQAAHRAHRGAASEHVYFLDMDTLLHTLTNRRMELLHILRQRGPATVRGLSQWLKRDYKNVHVDVRALKNAGLIETDEDGKVLVPWNRIATEMIPLAA